MDFFLSKIISRPLRNNNNNCDKSQIESDTLASDQLDNDVDVNDSAIPISENTSKSPASGKNAPGLDSDLSDRSTIDDTLSPDADTSYVNKASNITFSGLLDDFGGLKLGTPGGKTPKSKKQHDANASASSDDDVFQECENDLDETPTPGQDSFEVKTVTEPSNDTVGESFHFSTSVANSTITAGLDVTPNVSQCMNKSLAITPIAAEPSAHNLMSDEQFMSVNSVNGTGQEPSTVNNSAVEQQPDHNEIIIEQPTMDEEHVGNRTIDVPSDEVKLNGIANAEVEITVTTPNGTFSEQDLNVPVEFEERVVESEQVDEIVASIPVLNNDSSQNSTVEVTEPEVVVKFEEQTIKTEEDVKIVDTVPSVNDELAQQEDKSNAIEKEPQSFEAIAANEADEAIEAVETKAEKPSEYNESVNSPEVPLNVTTDFTKELNETPKSIQSEEIKDESIANTTIDPPNLEVQPIIQMQNSTQHIANTTFEPMDVDMDVDMDETADFPPPPPEILSANVEERASEEFLANQTIEMQDSTDEIPEPVSVPEPVVAETEVVEPKPAPLNVKMDTVIPEIKSAQSPSIGSPFKGPFSSKGNKNLNKTQVIFDDAKDKLELSKTIEIESNIGNLNKTIELPKVPATHPSDVNQTFVADDGLTNILDETRVINRRSVNFNDRTMAWDKTIVVDHHAPSVDTTFVASEEKASNSPATPAGSVPSSILDETRVLNRRSININDRAMNLNETVVVDHHSPMINATFVASEQNFETPPTKPESVVEEKREAVKENSKPFKVPEVPSKKAANPFASFGTTDSFDDEFQSPGFILNPTDFDFLLTKGTQNTSKNQPRDSILERFDPISGRKSIIPPTVCQKADPIVSVQPNVSTILEVSVETSGRDSLLSIQSSHVDGVDLNKTNVVEAIVQNQDKIVDLETSIKLDQSNSGDGDHSQASSTTETYETASIGEPLKADVTMSVGLIHDIKMNDNMKSMEPEHIKEQPILKMNDEQKVKQEMVDDIERKLKESEAREEALLRRITEKEKALNKMNSVIENYEKTMVEMLSEKDQLTQNYEKQLVTLKAERDANFHHLTSLETTFSDLHLKYEKSKQMALEVRENESKLEEQIEFCRQQMKLQEQRYDKLKNHALTQLENANATLENLNRNHSGEAKKLQAQLKKEEISRHSLMEQLAQKTKENEELVKICDELINNGADGS